MIYVNAGDRVRYGETTLKVLWPEAGATGKEVNEDAMVIEMTNGAFKGVLQEISERIRKTNYCRREFWRMWIF